VGCAGSPARNERAGAAVVASVLSQK
jgi:hypothetical protein